MGSPISCIPRLFTSTISKTPFFEEISYQFWKRYVDNTFTFINSSLHKVHLILKIINSINNPINVWNWKQSCTIFYWHTCFSRRWKLYKFCLSQNLRCFRTTAFLPSSKTKKMSEFNTFVNCSLNICSDPISFNSKCNI